MKNKEFKWEEPSLPKFSDVEDIIATRLGPLILFNNSYITKNDTLSRIGDNSRFRLSGSVFTEKDKTHCYLLYIGDNLVVDSPKIGDKFEVIYRMYEEI